MSTAACSARTRASCTTLSASAGASGFGRRAALRGAPRRRRGAGGGRPAGGPGHPLHPARRDVNWLGDAALGASAAAAWRLRCASAPPGSRGRRSCVRRNRRRCRAVIAGGRGVPRPGLRPLRERRAPGPRAGRRHHRPRAEAAEATPAARLNHSTQGRPMTAGPTTALMRKAYARWAPIYDVVYDKLTEPAARAAVNAADGLRTAGARSRRRDGPVPRLLPARCRGLRGRSLGGHAAPGEGKVDRRGLARSRACRSWTRPASDFRTGRSTP